MISESGSVEAMMRSPPGYPSFGPPAIDHTRLDRLDPMQNQLCRVCEEPAAGFHFGAFTCEGCKSFFGRTCNNQSVISECKNNYRCVVDKKNRTACKACRLRKCLMVGMSKSGSRYGRRSNWFKIHCLMQQQLGHSTLGPNPPKPSPPGSSHSSSSLSPTTTLNLWPSPPKSGKQSPIIEVRETASVSPPSSRSPESYLSAPTMVPRTSVVTPTASLSHMSALSSPFKSLLPSLPISTASLSTKTDTLTPSPMVPPIMSLYSGFPSPLTMGMPANAFPGVPLHKQALLSPLLAQSHLWQQMAAFRQNPLMRPMMTPTAPVAPDMDLISAEHKLLMERFAAVAAAAHAAAAAAQAAATNAETASTGSVEEKEDSKAEPQNCPMDLSSKKSDDGSIEGDSASPEPERRSSPSSLKSDLNRNIVDSETRATVKTEN